MDWYLGRDDEDLTVPKYEEVFDRLPSPDSWPSWVNMVGNVNSEKNLNVFGEEEFLPSEPMLYSHTFRQQSACSHDHSDAQLNDLPKFEEADDIFLDSLFDVDAGEIDASEISSDITQTSRMNDVMAVDLSNHIRDSTNDLSHVACFPPVKEMRAETHMSEEQSGLCENTREYISVDELVLQELQNLTQQLTETTRICFRDSLYRLAENSRYQTKYGQTGKEDPENYKPNSRVGPSRPQESNSKAIDRTIASLLFTTMRVYDSTSTSILDTAQSEHSCVHHRASSVEGGDANVPMFGFMNRPFPQLRHAILSSQ